MSVASKTHDTLGGYRVGILLRGALLVVLGRFNISSNPSAHLCFALALQNPPPPAKPVLIGTSDYSNVLFGKLQRAASLWGTNLNEPTTILRPGDKEPKLTKCLWNQFGMASPGSDGTLSRDYLLEPLSYYNDLRDALLFFDAVTPKESGFSLPFFNNGNDDEAIPTIDAGILQCAVERNCAHVYVLSSAESFEGCRQMLEAYSGQLASTIICLEEGVTMAPTSGWVTSRPQDLEGEFVGGVALRGYNVDGPLLSGSADIPVEDVAEVMMHVALRTDRAFNTYPRFLQLAPFSEEALVERPNADYFTMMGGLAAKKMAGTVRSVASWGSFLSPLGEVNTELGKRPDTPQ